MEKDLQNVALWILADGINPSWVMIKVGVTVVQSTWCLLSLTSTLKESRMHLQSYIRDGAQPVA